MGKQKNRRVQINITLFSNRFSNAVTKIDEEDYLKISVYSNWRLWYNLRGHFYACVYKKEDNKKKTVFMHRLLMNISDSDIQVDHINGDGLDNRKDNLRICCREQNLRNQAKPKGEFTSKFKGVSWNNRDKNWRASIWKNKGIFIGNFLEEIEAAKAYDIKAAELFGEYAKLNF